VTTFERSVLWWAIGGVAGAALSPRRPILGAICGAAIVGGVADVVIERNQHDRELEAKLAATEHELATLKAHE